MRVELGKEYATQMHGLQGQTQIFVKMLRQPNEIEYTLGGIIIKHMKLLGFL